MIERYKVLSNQAEMSCVEIAAVEKDRNLAWLWEEEFTKLIVQECIEAGRRCGGIGWQDLVKNADIEHNIRRALGLAKMKTLRDL